jgi:DNA-binding phage protein
MNSVTYNFEPIKQKIEELANRRGLSAATRRLGLSRQHIYRIAEGGGASVDVLRRVAAELGIHIADLEIKVGGIALVIPNDRRSARHSRST